MYLTNGSGRKLRFSVKVANRSAFATPDLAALFRACLKAHHVPARRYTLEVVAGRHAKVKRGKRILAAGRAPLGRTSDGGRFYHGSGAVEMVAATAEYKRAHDYSPATVPGFARWCWTLDHEVKHVVGWTDAELDASHDPQIAEALGAGWHDAGLHTAVLPPAWARGFEPLLPKAKAEPKPEALAAKAEARRAKRIERTEAALVKAEAKLRRTEKYITRLKRKLAAYQRAHLRVAAEKGGQS